MSASCTSNLQEQTCSFQICTMFNLRSTLNLQYLLQNLNLETVPNDIVELYLPHDNVACTHSWNECMRLTARRSRALVHCVIARASLTDRTLSGPMRAKYKHFRTMWALLTILPRISMLWMDVKAWSGDFVQLLRFLKKKIAVFHTLFRMTFHIIGPRRNLRSSQTWKFFCSPAEILDSSMVLHCQQHPGLSANPSRHYQGMMLVLPSQLVYWVLSTSDQYFVSFQPILCHPRAQIRISPSLGARISIPNWELFPSGLQ